MSPAHRGYLRYSHHLHDDQTRFPPEDAPDLGKEPDPAVFLSTNAGRRLEGRRRTPVAATGCLRALATTGRRRIRVHHRRIRGLHHCYPNAVAIPAANHPQHHPAQLTSTATVARSRPQAHPARSGRNGADLADTAVATPGGSPGHPSARRQGAPKRQPSLRPRGFTGERSGDGEAEKGLGVGERDGRMDQITKRDWRSNCRAVDKDLRNNRQDIGTAPADCG
ncbi:hypothetical protein OsJ_10196 [Oryza sativa Japonica Group]|uniref:Uncharacterized protein n=1 Tax=Oryza sativa subsp. japonica TaxID=39947 RepID=B9F745_ORYSJ|nr:hypothetical protein OsJ_10196 [Oryza sativa Japonica Group]